MSVRFHPIQNSGRSGDVRLSLRDCDDIRQPPITGEVHSSTYVSYLALRPISIGVRLTLEVRLTADKASAATAAQGLKP